MRSHIVALALAALAVTALAHEGHEHEDEELEEDPKAPSDVLVLTDATYQDAISQNPLILVEYYAPWCGHCQRLAPEYEKAATLLKGIAVVAKVDATKNEATAQAAEISGFPTLRLFSNGKPVEYRQERTAEAIVSFVKKAAEPGMKELKSAEEVAKFREENPTAVVAFFAEVEAEKEGAFTFGTYAKVVENLKLSSTTAFSFVSNAEFLGLPADAKAVVKMFRKADAKEVAFDIATFVDDASFAKWAAISALLPLDEISQSNFQSYFELRLPLFWLLLDPAADNVAVKATVEKIANEHFGKVLFVWLDSVKFPGQAKHIGLNGGKTPAGSLFVGSEKYPFPEDKEMTEEALNQFVSDALAGKLENFIRSSEIPEDNEQRNVFEIVGKTYKQVVEDTERDVVVEFFAEYCGHCKALAPVYDELGRLLKGVNSVRIARINVPDNDVPANIQGFPTVMLFKSDDKQNPIVYDGDRTLSSLLNWIKANAKTPFEFSEEAAAAAAEPKPVEENPKEEL